MWAGGGAFSAFLEKAGDWCVVQSEQFGYIVLCYYVDGRFENNHVFGNAGDLHDYLLDHWPFWWLYLKSKENGVSEYEDYEKNLTKEQKEEKEQTLARYEQALEVIMKE